jgi:FkbM family methyltransferase
MQRLLLWIYQAVLASGLLRTRAGRTLFEWCYDRYKAWYEAADVDRLQSSVRPGTWVVDVGANIGFFTARFARWVSGGGRVIAIEPEPLNVASLNRRLRKQGTPDRVIPVQAVAAEAPGALRLAVNPVHPADHRIAAEGIEVPAVTVDGLLEAHGWPAVSLIKIDVQGAEARVLAGAAETLRRFRPALFLEVDDATLKPMGTSAGEVLSRLHAWGYTPHRWQRDGRLQPLSPTVAALSCEQGRYTDFLFLHRDAAVE